MGAHPEAAAALEYSHRLVNTVFQDRSVFGMPYMRLALSNPVAGLTEILPSTTPSQFAPDTLITTAHTTLYWGAFGHPITATIRETLFGVDNDKGTYGPQVDRLILGSSLGAAALALVPEEVKSEWKEYYETLGDNRLEHLSAIAANAQVPMGIYQAGKVLRSKNMPMGSRVAFLWFLGLYEPSLVLSEMQAAIRKARANSS